jgi:hypothetical protein
MAPILASSGREKDKSADEREDHSGKHIRGACVRARNEKYDHAESADDLRGIERAILRHVGKEADSSGGLRANATGLSRPQ